jgi:hypothetical protein
MGTINNNSNGTTYYGSAATIDQQLPLIDDDELKKLIMNQLEFYFSRENLLHDKYLASQMDGDQFVPIEIIASFNMIRKLFTRSKNHYTHYDDINSKCVFISETVRQYSQSNMTQLQLDHQSSSKLRANHKRSVVILREIDKETPLSDILVLFDKCSVKCLNCEFAGNRSWYLTFKDEQEAQVAVQFLKEEVQTFNGEALYARIKTLPLPRVSNPTQIAVVPVSLPTSAMAALDLQSSSSKQIDDLSDSNELGELNSNNSQQIINSIPTQQQLPPTIQSQSAVLTQPASYTYPTDPNAYFNYYNQSKLLN